ncbi:hypothetical protein IV203_006947 [Nitzschia inconspicua]|uniref:SWIM-type domain-containing protein n=1 Tax=Nitzschia inconspicua TaxID=303405 RepID=A0A9K3KDX4_9STRA|nr:hypothetical protein IV203_006947 [Nitzschia inconspicua]
MSLFPPSSPSPSHPHQLQRSQTKYFNFTSSLYQPTSTTSPSLTTTKTSSSTASAPIITIPSWTTTFISINTTPCPPQALKLASHTVTGADEAHLLSNTEDLDYLQPPEFLTEAFLQFRELLEESLGDQNDVQNILHYLDKMVKCDPTFDYRVGRSSDGTVTGFVWQTGVMRRDFELYGDVLFVDCMGKSINTKGWPINTIAMLDGVATREALKGLSSWGLELYEKATRYSQRLHHRKNQDGSHHFAYNDGSSPLTLAGDTDACTCAAWVATGGSTQCSHMLLLQGGFCKEKWGARWHQRTALGTSPRSRESSAEQQLGLDHPPEGDNDMSMRYCGFGDEDVSGDGDVSGDEEDMSHRTLSFFIRVKVKF